MGVLGLWWAYSTGEEGAEGVGDLVYAYEGEGCNSGDYIVRAADVENAFDLLALEWNLADVSIKVPAG